MTFKEIIERESCNEDSIWLYREGMFVKAYERSAFFAHTLIHEFKLSRRYLDSILFVQDNKRSLYNNFLIILLTSLFSAFLSKIMV